MNIMAATAKWLACPYLPLYLPWPASLSLPPRRLSDKCDHDSDEAAEHKAHIYWELFPEAVIRLAALRYEWRPPDNLGEG